MVKVITEVVSKPHQQHAKLERRTLGDWGAAELAILGTPCSAIKEFADSVIAHLSSKWKIGYADADHKAGETGAWNNSAVYFTDKISYKQVSFRTAPTPYTQHALFNDCDLVLLNGNHFPGKSQIIFIDLLKPLEAKTEALTDVRLVILKDGETVVPEYLKMILGQAPVLAMNQRDEINQFFDSYLQLRTAPLNGLVLTGGKSERMGMDKSLIDYHGKPQRDYVYGLLSHLCRDVYVSCNSEQAAQVTLPKIEDRFLGIGPMGGLLSAFQSEPNSAWLTVACDIPYLSIETLSYLVARRDPSKLATAFMDEEGKFPEPLITIWEPKAYPILLLALGEGYSCPRKVLINSDTALLKAPDTTELQNVNDPASYARVRESFSSPAPQAPSE